MNADELFEAVRARVAAGRPTDRAVAVRAPLPATPDAVEAAESAIGFRLPPLVRRFYLELADGGVGPRSGFAPLEELVDWHVMGQESDPYPDCPPSPPAGVLFLCDFGCAMYALLDCRHPEGQMWWWTEGDRHKLSLTFSEWLHAWVSGELTYGYMEERKLTDEESWEHSWGDG